MSQHNQFTRATLNPEVVYSFIASAVCTVLLVIAALYLDMYTLLARVCYRLPREIERINNRNESVASIHNLSSFIASSVATRYEGNGKAQKGMQHIRDILHEIEYQQLISSTAILAAGLANIQKTSYYHLMLIGNYAVLNNISFACTMALSDLEFEGSLNSSETHSVLNCLHVVMVLLNYGLNTGFNVLSFRRCQQQNPFDTTPSSNEYYIQRYGSRRCSFSLLLVVTILLWLDFMVMLCRKSRTLNRFFLIFTRSLIKFIDYRMPISVKTTARYHYYVFFRVINACRMPKRLFFFVLFLF